MMGSRDGVMVRALASHQCGPGSMPARWIKFVVGFRFASKVFSPGSLVFLPSQKPTSPNSNSTRIEDPHENQLKPMWLSLYLFKFSYSLLMFRGRFS